MENKKCANCKFWKLDFYYKDFQEGNRCGACSGMLCNGVEITTYGNGGLEKIITDDTFYCRNFTIHAAPETTDRKDEI